ncbi:aspartate 1-decarboxylase [Salibacterium salarium]|uniref:Aspartate 1-decarboxylase n=1 Tax=Salibacterium salarium TaxID=284579 RepID=A0A428N5W0_9BACI|nr:aspartate 1-decarboxylase [Salibacterium salarium]MDQ0299408.1 aspartate 1-decarboxylase [Salibacterium salarium]RSL33875.1 aspartate 1-decarboxylase [Salibacterium salarium]
MFRTMMKSKLHRAEVTEANLHYVGSITIDESLLEAVDIVANEKVQVVNNNNGERLETYVIPGEKGSGVICLNGAAARMVQPGDIVIIIAYASIETDKCQDFVPNVAVLGENNNIIDMLTHETSSTIY